MSEIVNPLLRETEAAKILRVSASRLQKWRWQGKGPKYLRLGHKGCAVRYQVNDLKHFLEETQSPATAPL